LGDTYFAALCLSAQQITRLFSPDQVPHSPSDASLIAKLIESLPTRTADAGQDYFHSAVAMKRKKDRNQALDKIHQYDDKDFWDYWTRFLSFLDQYLHYWDNICPGPAFRM
jgi:hypothetical protein